MTIAETQLWTRLEDELDTWLIPSSTNRDVLYHVNGRCTCPDYLENGVPGGWCKHRLARAIAKRAEEILKEEKQAKGAATPPAPEQATASHETDSKAEPFNGQARRIDLVVAYGANEVNSLAHINANGRLVAFKADGQEAAPPTRLMADLYRWLQAQGYIPDEFKWLGWERGLRQRRQSYVREVAQ